jgi:DNA-binding transcriptional LysR family regulator
MDIRQLKHFLALYERRHYGRAADQLELSQSALTKSIRKLETTIGCKLFERGRYGAVPTVYGEALVKRAKRILAEERLAVQELHDIKDAGHGIVRVGIGFSCAHRIAPEAIGRLNASHPGITVVASEGASLDLLEGLLQGQYDFVLSSPPASFARDPELRMEKLFRDRDMIVAARGHPLLDKSRVGLDDLAACPWAVPNKYKDMIGHIQKVFHAEGIVGPRISVRTDSTSLTMSLIQRAGHIALLSEDFLTTSKNIGGISTIRSSEFERPRIGYLFTRHRSRMSAAAEVLADQV